MKNCKIPYTDIKDDQNRILIETTIGEKAYPKDGKLRHKFYDASNMLRLFYRGKQILYTNLTGVRINGAPTTPSTVEEDIKFIYDASGSSEGGGRNISYIVEGGALPSDPEIGDHVYETTTGTAEGELCGIFEWNGFVWVTYGFKHNLNITFETNEYYQPIEQLVQPIARLYHIAGRNYTARYQAADNGNVAYNLYLQNVYRINDLVHDGNYVIGTLAMTGIDYNLTLENYEAGFISDLTIYEKQLNQPAGSTTPTMSISIKNSVFTNASIVVQQHLLTNPVIEGLTAQNIDLNIGKVIDRILVKDVVGVMYFDFQNNFDSTHDTLPTGTVIAEVDNLRASEGHTFDTLAFSNQNGAVSGEESNLPIQIIIKNQSSFGALALNYLELESITFENSNLGDLQNISIDNVTTTTAVLDKLLQDMLDLNVGANVSADKELGISSITGATPTQSILDIYTQRGFTVTVQ